MSEIKFTDDEMKNLADLRQEYTDVQMALGNLQVQKWNLEEQLGQLEEKEIELKDQLSQAREKETSVANELNEKYGAGSLDPNTGVFTPQEAAPAVEEKAEDESK